MNDFPYHFMKPTTLVAIIVDLDESILDDLTHINALWTLQQATIALGVLVGWKEAASMIRAAKGEGK